MYIKYLPADFVCKWAYSMSTGVMRESSCVLTRVSVSTNTHTHTHAHTHIYTYTYICIHVYTYTHIHKISTRRLHLQMGIQHVNSSHVRVQLCAQMYSRLLWFCHCVLSVRGMGGRGGISHMSRILICVRGKVKRSNWFFRSRTHPDAHMHCKHIFKCQKYVCVQKNNCILFCDVHMYGIQICITHMNDIYTRSESRRSEDLQQDVMHLEIFNTS